MSDMPMDDMSPEATPKDDAQGPGSQLAACREKQGWTIEQVARQLNLAPRQIQALEEDNHTALPGAASVRGFIRSYAKLLRIDPEPLLAMMPAPVASINEPIPVRRALSKPFSGERLPAIGERGAPQKTLILIGLAAVLLAAALMAERQGWFALSMKSGTAPHGTTVSSTMAKSMPQDTATPPPQNIAASQEVATPIPAAQPEAASDAEENDAHPKRVPAAAKNGDLVLNFREESWLEVYRLQRDDSGDGTRLEAQLMPAGSTEAFDMSGPVSLVIGNAAGVDVSLRGKPVDLSPAAKSNVARLTLK